MSWHGWAAYEFRRELETIFGDLAIPALGCRDPLDDRIHVGLRDLFDVARERVNAEWEEDSGGPYLTKDVAAIAAEVTAAEIGSFREGDTSEESE